MRIGLLQCDHVQPELRPRFGDYSDFFIRLFQKQSKDIVLDVFPVQQGRYPKHIDDYQGFVSTGSRQSVYEPDEWIRHFQAFVRKLYQQRKKFIGICFGHQMIAQALGGKCARTERGWGIGVKEIRILKSCDWMQPELEYCRLIVSHQDQITELPGGAALIGGNRHCPYAVITAGEHFLGIQAHPEFTPAYANELMQMRRERIGAQVVREAEKTLDDETHEDIVAQWMIRFLEG